MLAQCARLLACSPGQPASLQSHQEALGWREQTPFQPLSDELMFCGAALRFLPAEREAGPLIPGYEGMQSLEVPITTHDLGRDSQKFSTSRTVSGWTQVWQVQLGGSVTRSSPGGIAGIVVSRSECLCGLIQSSRKVFRLSHLGLFGNLYVQVVYHLGCP